MVFEGGELKRRLLLFGGYSFFLYLFELVQGAIIRALDRSDVAREARDIFRFFDKRSRESGIAIRLVTRELLQDQRFLTTGPEETPGGCGEFFDQESLGSIRRNIGSEQVLAELVVMRRVLTGEDDLF